VAGDVPGATKLGENQGVKLRSRAAALATTLAAAVAFEGAARAEEPAPDEAPKKADDEGRWTLFPVISSAPETSLMLGGLTMYHFRVGGPARAMANGKMPRRSSVGLVAAYTFKNQFLFSFFPSLYLQGETWNIGANLEALRFPDTFYAVGRDSAEDSAEDFTQRSFAGAVQVTHTVVSSVRAGGEVAVAHATLTEVESGGLLDTDQVPGSDGGLLVAIGPTISWDDRDQDMAPRTGSLYQLTAHWFPSALGSDFDFADVTLDARHYFPITGEHVFALQGYAHFSRGDVPFQRMAHLGGSNALRGYFAGRYIDRHMIAAQAEYRLPVYWRIGATLFAGIGDVARTVGDFDPSDPKYAGGFGIRFALNKKDGVNLRFDFALSGDQDFAFYLSLGEAF